MKNIKILLLLVVVILSYQINAQSFSSNLLKNKLWKYKDKGFLTKEYTETKSIVYFNGVATLEESYYLSDTIVSSANFDNSKVGVSNTGKYIVTPKACFEIIKIIDKELIIRYVNHQHLVYLYAD